MSLAKSSQHPKSLAKISQPINSLTKILQHHKPLAKIFAWAAKNFIIRFCLAKPMWNANGLLCEIPTVRRKAKSHLKILFKDLQSRCLFRTTHPLLQKAYRHLHKQFPRHSMPCGHQEKEETSTSCPISAMAHIRGAQNRPVSISWGLTKRLRSSGFISSLLGPDRSIF